MPYISKRLVVCSLVAWLSFYGIGLAQVTEPDTLVLPMGSHSMLPTINFGDNVVIRLKKLSDPIHRGDIVAFWTNQKKLWISRVVGLPGESINVSKARVFINEKAVPRVFFQDKESTSANKGRADATIYKELLPDTAEHLIMQTDDDSAPLSNTFTFRISESAFFLMGDNRDNAVDSRLPVESLGLGFVARSSILGVASTNSSR